MRLSHSRDVVQHQMIEFFEFSTGIISCMLTKSKKKYFNLVAIRKINFDDYSASYFAAMILITMGYFSSHPV